jgi:hypothetical protein
VIWLAAPVAVLLYFAAGLFADSYLGERWHLADATRGLTWLRLLGWPVWWGTFFVVVGVLMLLGWAHDTGHRLGAQHRRRTGGTDA